MSIRELICTTKGTEEHREEVCFSDETSYITKQHTCHASDSKHTLAGLSYYKDA